jgi:hypothetical protein
MGVQTIEQGRSIGEGELSFKIDNSITLRERMKIYSISDI